MRVSVLGLLLLLAPTVVVADTRDGIAAFRSGQYDKALKELRPSAKAGDADAQYLLGRMHAAGLGVEKSHEAAAEFYRQAAEGGSLEGAQEYGTALVSGTGVTQDLEGGLKWLFVADLSGLPTARTYINQFVNIVPRQTVIKARVDARTWLMELSKKKTER